jgi:HAE1 family hydrophobic/amphiphilic exporter-1
MRLSSIAVSRPITTFMVFLAIVVLGYVSYRRLPVQLLPDITLPTIGVFASTPYSAAENLDRVTRRLEGIAAELPRVKSIRSWTFPEGMWMRVDFEYGTNLQYAQVDFEERLLSFQQSLNDRQVFINCFPFSTADFEAQYMELSVRGKGDLEALFRTTAEQVETQLKAISGVSKVELRGLRDQAAQVDFNTDLLAGFGLELGTVIGRIQAAASADSYLGTLRVPGERHFVRLNDRVRTVEELADLYVDGKGIVRLRDVATIDTGVAAPRWVNRYDGKNAIGITMEREAGENMIDLARKTRKRIAEINSTLPPGLELHIDEDLAKYVEDAIAQVKRLAGVGALLALLVPLVFFRSLRVALIVFLSVPICLISVFNLFYAAGMSINVFSIVGLALGVGMLVDNSIVVVENAFRLYEQGASPAEAAGRGGVEVSQGLIAATLTTAAVFVPMAFLEGEFKLFIKEPTLALVFPLLLSLVVALTLIPVLTYLVLRTRRRRGLEASGRNPIRRAYAATLKAALRHRSLLLFIVAVAVTFTFLESCQRVRETAGNQGGTNDYARFFFQAPRGSLLSDVDTRVRVIEERLAAHPSIESFRVNFNGDGGQASMKLKPRKERQFRESVEEFRATILDYVGEVPGLELSRRRLNEPMAAPPVDLGDQGSIELKAMNIDTLQPFAERLIDLLRTHPQISNARIEQQRTDPYYLAAIDRDKSGVYQVKADMLGRYVQVTRSSGTISQLQLKDGDLRTNVSFIISAAEGSTIDQVRAMTMFTPGLGQVPLGELATFQTSQAPGFMRRQDRQDSLEVTYFHDTGVDVAKLKEDVKKLFAAMPNPGGVVMQFTGEAQRLDERQNQFFFILIFGSLLVYVVMAAVFESFWVPFTILATNPLMIIGIVWGLDIAGLPLDDMAVFGVILLVGLAVNNGIVMMDRALAMQRAGYSRVRAIFEASLTRLRPITMTYLTTTLGLLPMAIIGEEGDQWRPVSVVVIGGLTSATLLTLVVLPCFYLIGDDFVRWARRPFLNLVHALFDLVESTTNAVMHPVRLLRGRMAFAPAARPFISAAAVGLLAMLRTPGAAIAGLPGDAIWALRWTPRGLRGTPQRLAPMDTRPPGRIRRVLTAAVRLPWRLVGGILWLMRTAARVRLRLRPPFVRLAPPRVATPAPVIEPPAVVASEPPPTVELRNIQVVYPAGPARRLWCALRRRPLPGFAALSGIHLTMDTGLVGLLGPNGAGKTTLLRVLAGLLPPTRGTVRLFGVSHREAGPELAPLIGYLPQNHGHYDWMTLYQYLDFFALVLAQTIERARALEAAGAGHPALRAQLDRLTPLTDPRRRHEAILAAAAEVTLTEVLDRRLAGFSGGMKQRAGLARILLQAPPILIVDEPTAGLDPVERVKVRALLSRLARHRLVIFSTHIVEDLEHDCDALAILASGRLRYSGPPAGLLERWRGSIREAFPAPGQDLTQLRDALEAAGHRLLYRVTRDGREGFRLIGIGLIDAPNETVEPTLEDALIATLDLRDARRLSTQVSLPRL